MPRELRALQSRHGSQTAPRPWSGAWLSDLPALLPAAWRAPSLIIMLQFPRFHECRAVHKACDRRRDGGGGVCFFAWRRCLLVRHRLGGSGGGDGSTRQQCLQQACAAWENATGNLMRGACFGRTIDIVCVGRSRLGGQRMSGAATLPATHGDALSFLMSAIYQHLTSRAPLSMP